MKSPASKHPRLHARTSRFLAAMACMCLLPMACFQTHGEESNAFSWPPPIEEKILVGTWVRKNAPEQGMESNTLLVLRQDRSWIEAECWGPLTGPKRIKKYPSHSKWEVVNVSGSQLWTQLWFKFKDGGSRSWQILKVTPGQIDFSAEGGAIINFMHYTRCDGQLTKTIDAMLEKDEPMPPSTGTPQPPEK